MCLIEVKPVESEVQTNTEESFDGKSDASFKCPSCGGEMLFSPSWGTVTDLRDGKLVDKVSLYAHRRTHKLKHDKGIPNNIILDTYPCVCTQCGLVQLRISQGDIEVFRHVCEDIDYKPKRLRNT